MLNPRLIRRWILRVVNVKRPKISPIGSSFTIQFVTKKRWWAWKLVLSLKISEEDLMELHWQIEEHLREKLNTFCACSCGYINSPDDWVRHFKAATEGTAYGPGDPADEHVRTA